MFRNSIIYKDQQLENFIKGQEQEDKNADFLQPDLMKINRQLRSDREEYRRKKKNTEEEE